jgi:IS1 family transposase
MANILKRDKQVAVISMLLEGSSVRSIERITGVHRDTSLRLMVRVANACAHFSDRTLRDLDCKRVEVDEIWAFVAKKNKNVREDDNWSRVGDQYTFVALDADTKLIPSYTVGKRTVYTAQTFINDLASRMRSRIQISSDGFAPYYHTIATAFGRQVDYATIVKEYAETPAGRGRYSPPKVISCEKDDLIGTPDMDLVSTSYVERSNLSIRMHCRRLTRLTNAFSKKLENLKAAMDLYFCFYNFVRFHSTIRCTPAMEAGVMKDALGIGDLVDMAA